MSKSRLSMRREVEAAEAIEADGAKKKTRKKATKATGDKPAKKATTRKKAVRKTRRAREAAQRRRIVWVVYSSTMREEGRFLYHERDKAEERLELLLSKGKRRYFIQPIKEALNSDGTPVVQVGEAPPEVDMDDEVVPVVDGAEGSDDIELDVDAELALDDDDDDDAEPAEEEVAESE